MLCIKEFCFYLLTRQDLEESKVVRLPSRTGRKISGKKITGKKVTGKKFSGNKMAGWA